MGEGIFNPSELVVSGALFDFIIFWMPLERGLSLFVLILYLLVDMFNYAFMLNHHINVLVLDCFPGVSSFTTLSLICLNATLYIRTCSLAGYANNCHVSLDV